ncbi:hypothetical protein [Glutamicibacter nicotianae]|uniref:hypothetical protein n=1 Tax=Glutamicibacter nicotianae TaxID=37929 RepID=UPI00255428CE|nr:hypothetical protein [Glutamicibacter nicotianae]WIV43060.1 hypothetical protein QQS42_12150 [Glutamicibacter nicotianae]
MNNVQPFVEWLAENWPDAGSLAIACAAAIFAGFSLGHTKSQRDSSVRQAIAAESQVDMMRRQNELLEQQITSGQSSSAGPAMPYIPPWQVNWFKGDTFSLLNGGHSTEYDVSIEFPVHSVHRGGSWEKLGPRESATFMFVATLATPGRDITISWRRSPGGELQTWKTQIPARP